MASLKDYDYNQLMDRQLVSFRTIEELQNAAGDCMGDRILRKTMITYGAYLAIQIVKEYDLDREYLFEHLDIEELARCGYYRWLPKNYDNREEYHKPLLQNYILAVVQDIYIPSHNGMNIKKELYDRIVDTRIEWINKYHKEPETEVLVRRTGVTVKIAKAVQEDERWKKQRAIKVIEERRNFGRFMEIIKYSDLQYVVKVNLIHNISEMSPRDREFFYYIFGVYDGYIKSAVLAAYHFDMDPVRAVEKLDFAMNRLHKYKLSHDYSTDRVCEALIQYMGEEGRKEILPDIAKRWYKHTVTGRRLLKSRKMDEHR